MTAWDKTADWFWEGNVQQKIIDYVNNQEGFQIVHFSNPKAKGKQGQGPDIVAEWRGILRQVEVKGYPPAIYTQGSKKGQAKQPSQQAGQAKEWFAEALLALILAKSKDSKLEIALGLPELERYTRLLNETSWARKMMCIHCYLVDESGAVKLLTE